MASGDRDGDGFIQVSELAAYVQDRVPGQQRVTIRPSILVSLWSEAGTGHVIIVTA